MVNMPYFKDVMYFWGGNRSSYYSIRVLRVIFDGDGLLLRTDLNSRGLSSFQNIVNRYAKQVKSKDVLLGRG